MECSTVYPNLTFFVSSGISEDLPIGLHESMFIPTLQVSQFLSALNFFRLYRAADANAFALSDMAFVPTIQGQGDPEQQAKWLPLARDYKIIGAYAQTELGHGESSVVVFDSIASK